MGVLGRFPDSGWTNLDYGWKNLGYDSPNHSHVWTDLGYVWKDLGYDSANHSLVWSNLDHVWRNLGYASSEHSLVSCKAGPGRLMGAFCRKARRTPRRGVPGRTPCKFVKSVSCFEGE